MKPNLSTFSLEPEKAEELFNEDNIEEELDPEGAQDNAECEVEGVDDCGVFVAFDYDKHPKDKSKVKSSLEHTSSNWF